MNEYMLPWKTKMTGIAAFAEMFVRGSHAFLRNFSSPYHNVHLGTPCNQADLQLVLDDLRPVVSTDRELAASLSTSWRQARFAECRPGHDNGILGTFRQSTKFCYLVQRTAHTRRGHSTRNNCSGWETHVVESSYFQRQVTLKRPTAYDGGGRRRNMVG